MPALAFLHPALLWGLALGAVPILLHLLQRRRYRVRRWAAMEFLRASVRRSSRRLRIEQWLLLIVRALILILAALALARPVWQSTQWGWLGSRAASQVVVVLDNSYGLGWRLAGGGRSGEGRGAAAGRFGSAATQFEAARARALELVRTGLTPGDSVSLVLASEPARAVVRRPTFNLKEIAAQLQHAAPADRPADMAGAARLCQEILRSSKSAAREVYLITNAQAAGWKRSEAADAWRRVAAVSRLHFIPTLPARGANLSVDDLRISGPAVAGRSLSLQARISDWGDREEGHVQARDVVVTLHVDGQPVASNRLEVPARGTAEAHFEHTFAGLGPHTVMVSLPGDDLPADDRRYAVVTARASVRVLILNGHPDPDPRQDAAFFVAAALAPDVAPSFRSAESSSGPDAAPSGNSSENSPSGSSALHPFDVQVLDGSFFRSADLSQWDVVVLADVPRLDDSDRRRLASFVSDGGGLLLLPGPSALPAFYNGDLLTRSPALMPARLGPAWEAGAAAPVLDLGSPAAYLDHPVLARFRGAADVDLTTARFDRFFRLTPLAPPSGARVLCRFTDGSPAMAERAVGLGRVTLLASPPLPGWNTLPFKPAFLPFLDGLVGYLGQGPNNQHNLRVGDPLVWAIPSVAHRSSAESITAPEVGALLEGPNGRRITLHPLREDQDPSSIREVSLDSVPRAGFYHLLWRGRSASGVRGVFSPGPDRSGRSARAAGTRTGERGSGVSPTDPADPAGPSDLSTLNSQLSTPSEDWFAANLDTSASDPRALSRREIEGLLRPAAIRWVEPHEALAAVVGDSRQGREAWRGLLLGALGLMLCESGMAQLFGRRRRHD